MANKMVATGTKCQRISNNAPTNICVDDVDPRKRGVQVAKNWLDAGGVLGAKSMRMNSGGPRIAPTPGQGNDGYPKDDELATLLSNCIASFKEMADYGAGGARALCSYERSCEVLESPGHLRRAAMRQDYGEREIYRYVRAGV
jgi:hypothetical protein